MEKVKLQAQYGYILTDSGATHPTAQPIMQKALPTAAIWQFAPKAAVRMWRQLRSSLGSLQNLEKDYSGTACCSAE